MKVIVREDGVLALEERREAGAAATAATATTSSTIGLDQHWWRR